MALKLKKPGLLPKVIAAIILGVVFSWFAPLWFVRIFSTFNDIFGNFLGFAIPLIILGLVASGIAELGAGAGRLLGITALIAYGSTVFSGFFSYFTCLGVYPRILAPGEGVGAVEAADAVNASAYFTVDMPPVMGVTSALILAFVIGLGLSAVKGDTFRQMLLEFKEVTIKLIAKVIIPALPVYIFGIFLKMGAEGQVGSIMGLFAKVILVIFVMHILLLLMQFTAAGLVAKRNPLKLLKNMMPAYVTALGTQSSAATIPVTLRQTVKNGVDEELADFVVPLCATIHLSGSILKIVACAMAIMWMNGMPLGLNVYAGFIFMLGLIMVAAPGVPGGAIMASLGVLQSMLGFDENLLGLMIALYITMDSFGTAGNVTGDGAIAVVMDKIYRRWKRKEAVCEA